MVGLWLLQRLRLRQGLRLRAIAVGLRVAGRPALADRLLSGWKVRLAGAHTCCNTNIHCVIALPLSGALQALQFTN